MQPVVRAMSITKGNPPHKVVNSHADAVSAVAALAKCGPFVRLARLSEG